MADTPSLFTDDVSAKNASQDPMILMMNIATDNRIQDESVRKFLLEQSTQRFKNRRRMAYIALIAVLVTLAVALIAALFDPQGFKNLHSQSSIIIWINGFLISIVAAYYGVSAWKPSS